MFLFSFLSEIDERQFLEDVLAFHDEARAFGDGQERLVCDGN